MFLIQEDEQPILDAHDLGPQGGELVADGSDDIGPRENDNGKACDRSSSPRRCQGPEHGTSICTPGE